MGESKATTFSMSNENARGVLNAWSKTGFFRARNFGDRIRIEGISSVACREIRLRVQYEDRSLKEVKTAFHGEAIDDVGVRADPQEIPVEPPTDCEDRTVEVEVPHSERVEGCSSCGGAGRSNCRMCQGVGRTACHSCHGSGWRSHIEAQPPVRNREGRMTFPPPKTVRLRCSCFGGQTQCSVCRGQKKVTCSSCEGMGRVKVSNLLVVTFSASNKVCVLNPTSVPDDMACLGEGEMELEKRPFSGPAELAVDADLQAAVEGLLERTRPKNEATSRILSRMVTVKRVPIWQVTYAFSSSDNRKAWIFGTDHRVFAPRAPRAWGRVFAVFVAGLIFLGIVALLLTH
jgi:hypothetical protein